MVNVLICCYKIITLPTKHAITRHCPTTHCQTIRHSVLMYYNSTPIRLLIRKRRMTKQVNWNQVSSHVPSVPKTVHFLIRNVRSRTRNTSSEHFDLIVALETVHVWHHAKIWIFCAQQFIFLTSNQIVYTYCRWYICFPNIRICARFPRNTFRCRISSCSVEQTISYN